ncbi:unnamed protein product [Acanthoscelides obtectus]|uniref:Uncharacterized protein n=1 Tax=Acanthoscelides obtectus TaxID=200917 RepID=A0A9P0KTP8_ACAOB|nr:unnamed protein product [Acanthoscelides obtectus]CAK1647348.1 hypothetical protein AOBTE_LOCUS15192 [Acanthoscelides obtectus]
MKDRVLRAQPEDIYTFVADYLDALMITRENARVAARLVQSITEITTTTCEFLEEAGMERMEAERVMQVVRATFQKQLQSDTLGAPPPEIEEANMVLHILDEAQIGPEKGEASAIIIQRAYRNFKQRRDMERELLSGMIDWRVAARSAIYLYRKTGVTNEEANRAATLIKAAYKGYYTRRFMRRLSEKVKMGGKEEGEEVAIPDDKSEGSFTDEEKQSRAVKINYDTVVPHVDFGGAENIPGHYPGGGGSSASLVGAHVYNAILHKTFEILPLEEDVPAPPVSESEHPPPPPPTAEEGAERDQGHEEVAPVEPEASADPEHSTVTTEESHSQEVHFEAPAE